MRHLNQTAVTRARIAKWMLNSQSITNTPFWTERRMAINIGGQVHLIANGQVFQCAHCGHYDPEWSVTEVLSFLKENMNIEPYEIEIVCSLPVAKEDNENS